LTRTLAGVEPIVAAMSEADFPWLAISRMALITAGVNTRRGILPHTPWWAQSPQGTTTKRTRSAIYFNFDQRRND
jgi:hypothetical protein